MSKQSKTKYTRGPQPKADVWSNVFSVVIILLCLGFLGLFVYGVVFAP